LKRKIDKSSDHPILKPALRQWLKSTENTFLSTGPKLWDDVSEALGFDLKENSLANDQLLLIWIESRKSVIEAFIDKKFDILTFEINSELKRGDLQFHPEVQNEVLIPSCKPKTTKAALYYYLMDFMTHDDWQKILKVCWNFDKQDGCERIWFKMAGEKPRQNWYCSKSCRKSKRQRRHVKGQILDSDG